MAGHDTDIDAESLRRAVIQIGQSTDDTEAALMSFVAALESQGEPWGADELGSLIAMSYQGIYAAFMDCFGSNLEVIDDYAERIGLAADDYDATDRAAAGRTDQITAAAPDLPL